MTSKGRCPLKDGDKVETLVSVRVDGYWYDPEYMARGCWDKMYFLPGTVGTIIHAKTPCARAKLSGPQYFSNMDIEYMGQTYRVRPFQHELRRMK
jgi:hypothetical protein